MSVHGDVGGYQRRGHFSSILKKNIVEEKWVKERGLASVDGMVVAGQWWKRNGKRAKGRQARD